MARGAKSKFKSGLPLVEEQKILAMNPKDLAVEVSFERNAIEALRVQKTKDHQIINLKKEVKDHDELLASIQDVADAKSKYEEVKTDNMTKDHLKAKEDLAALNKGWNNDIKDRKKKLNYMEKMLGRHIESGALKRII